MATEHVPSYVHTAQCTLHTATPCACTANTAKCTMHTAHCTLHTAHCTLHRQLLPPRCRSLEKRGIRVVHQGNLSSYACSGFSLGWSVGGVFLNKMSIHPILPFNSTAEVFRQESVEYHRRGMKVTERVELRMPDYPCPWIE